MYTLDRVHFAMSVQISEARLAMNFIVDPATKSKDSHGITMQTMKVSQTHTELLSE